MVTLSLSRDLVIRKLKTEVVPMRFVSEEMGLSVGWNNKDKLVTLSSNTSLPSEPSNGSGMEATTNLI
ncbi:stalk domain-containing protein [Paenibacillus sp. Y412MC10]|uniref:stalk domain-containing protein n=1 Tax=Geobacillus sp. (strain Y412MC10) TaxID=481743 RepID=UPI0009DDC811|nr:stalk domain-containing protein [Paenibacillus sp. Y412MC10]